MTHNKTTSDIAALPNNANLGIGWYTPHQWLLLKQVSVDAHQLDDTYEDWLINVERVE